MADTWALKGFLYPDLGAHVDTTLIPGPFALGVSCSHPGVSSCFHWAKSCFAWENSIRWRWNNIKWTSSKLLIHSPVAVNREFSCDPCVSSFTKLTMAQVGAGVLRSYAFACTARSALHNKGPCLRPTRNHDWSSAAPGTNFRQRRKGLQKPNRTQGKCDRRWWLMETAALRRKEPQGTWTPEV